MTREEAKQWFVRVYSEIKGKGYTDENEEAYKMAIFALEQQPCEDAVSRDEVFEIICRETEWYDIRTQIEQLPSVTQKSGKWIDYNYPGHECVYCSNCKTEYYEEDLYLGDSEFPKYCPNCGARMESEEV